MILKNLKYTGVIGTVGDLVQQLSELDPDLFVVFGEVKPGSRDLDAVPLFAYTKYRITPHGLVDEFYLSDEERADSDEVVTFRTAFSTLSIQGRP